MLMGWFDIIKDSSKSNYASKTLPSTFTKTMKKITMRDSPASLQFKSMTLTRKKAKKAILPNPSPPKKVMEKDVDRIQSIEKELSRSLTWFQQVIQKGVMVSSSATDILQKVIELHTILKTALNNEESTMLMSEQSRVYQNLAKLIHWADKMMLNGHKDIDKASIEVIAKDMAEGVSNLVKLTVTKLEEKEESKRRHSDTPAPVSKARVHRISSLDPADISNDYDTPPLSPKEREILENTPITWSSEGDIHNGCHSDPGEDPTAPPKPFLPENRVLIQQTLDMSDEIPPALPPKLRYSTNLNRSSSGSSGSLMSHQSDMSSSSGSVSRTDSKRSSQISSTTSEDRVSLESSQILFDKENRRPSPLPDHLQSIHLHPLSASYESGSETSDAGVLSDTPPALPEKQRNVLGRKLSDYDNMTDDDGPMYTNRKSLLSIDGEHCSLPTDMVFDIPSDEIDGGEEAPRHINNYLGLIDGYTEQQFQASFVSGRMPACQPGERRSLDFLMSSFPDETPPFPTDICDTPKGSTLPPSLPIKMKDMAGLERQRLYSSPERSRAQNLELKKKSESMIYSSEDVKSAGLENPSAIEADFDDEGRGILNKIDVSEYLVRSEEAVPSDGSPPIRGGPVDALIVYAADMDKKDLVFYEAFLTSYRTFILPKDLIDKLLYRYRKFRNKPDTAARLSRNAFFLLLRVAGDLIGQVDNEILKNLMDLVFQLLCDGDLSLAKILREKILCKMENNKDLILSTAKVPVCSLPSTIKCASLFEFSTSELAQQMTILDSELFLKIEIPEVLLWAREQSEKLSPNLTIFTEHFNKVSYWVRSLILQESKASDREKLLQKFIKIMKYLRKLNNFNSYLAILSALDSAPVRRLDWPKSYVEDLKEYCILIDSTSSFRAYRAALAEAEPPCIPYLGLILQDITFIHIGNPDLLEDGKINFTKCWQHFTILDSMRRFKQYQYDNLVKKENVLSFFNGFNDYLDEEAMWQLSKAIKPQGGQK
ncbi:rap guanine nucleotide exchange factor 1-like isoform X2 [Anneissia japonica]|uniref:rap guanine nucleotide exchange factor 1-like isoform X2 n=1 Tax=Anneissia japonica TaxID=1529436 RepID=UPI0014258BDD|nr:rap guanine nucleotide exchange factor 1-like isoform X2 [Anneissia japonica]